MNSLPSSVIDNEGSHALSGDGHHLADAAPLALAPPAANAAARRKPAPRADSAIFKSLPKIAQALRWNQVGDATTMLRGLAERLAETHPAVASSITKQLPNQLQPTRLTTRPDHLVAMREPKHGFDAVVVSADIAAQCAQIVDEHNRRETLAAFSLQPRHKVLLSGPPGNGKTMLAEAFAFEMKVPYLVAKTSGIIDSHLGTTGRNVDTLMDYAASGPCVLFLDEFEGVSKRRDSGMDVGEMHRITNQLLLSMQDLPSHVMLVCATNLDDMIDKAIRRRFDFHLDLARPSNDLRLKLALRELDPSLTPGHDLTAMAARVAALAETNLHEVAQLCRRLRRQLALYGQAELPPATTDV
jgi:SpoVK/Ycf46/Vps4 family AAA+-type ATPase